MLVVDNDFSRGKHASFIVTNDTVDRDAGGCRRLDSVDALCVGGGRRSTNGADNDNDNISQRQPHLLPASRIHTDINATQSCSIRKPADEASRVSRPSSYLYELSVQMVSPAAKDIVSPPTCTN